MFNSCSLVIDVRSAVCLVGNSSERWILHKLYHTIFRPYCSFGHQHVSPRGLLASFLRTLVCVEGIVTKCTSVRPKLVKSVHFNPSNQTFTTREYRDSMAMELGLDSGGR